MESFLVPSGAFPPVGVSLLWDTDGFWDPYSQDWPLPLLSLIHFPVLSLVVSLSLGWPYPHTSDLNCPVRLSYVVRTTPSIQSPSAPSPNLLHPQF